MSNKSVLPFQSKKRKHEILGTVLRINGRTVGQVIADEYTKDITNNHILKYRPRLQTIFKHCMTPNVLARYPVSSRTQTRALFTVRLSRKFGTWEPASIAAGVNKFI